MRYVVVGLGAIGGTIACRLQVSGYEVVGVARGAHYEAVAAGGMLLRTPSGDRRVRLDVHRAVGDVGLREGDVVVIAVKSQDTPAVLGQLATCAPTKTSVVCAQNGVANEPEVLRWFSNVYGMVVMSPALHLQPGVVAAYSTPTVGILDIGRFPTGEDVTSRAVAADLTSAGYSSRSIPDIARWKYAKLITNLGNTVEAVCGPSVRGGPLTQRLQDEARAVLDHHHFEYASDAEDRERRGEQLHVGVIDGAPRPGGSVWQSVKRGLAVTEVDYLCGEVVRLARMLNREAPANQLLQSLTRQVASGNVTPESISEEDILGQLPPASG